MRSEPFGSLPSGEKIHAYTLANAAGASLQAITLGGIVTSLRVPDRRGAPADVVLGFDRLAPYVEGRPYPYFGALIGRLAGRVIGGRLSVEGRTCALELNQSPNHLHGGRKGLDRRVWTAQPAPRADGADSLRLTYRSPDGEEGYPGNVDLAVTYTLTHDNVFVVETEASADRPTPIALTQHSYFNLAGEGDGTVEGHEVQIFSEAHMPYADEAMTPSGRVEPVAGRACDLTRPRRLGEVLPRLFQSHGDFYRLPGDPAKGVRQAARVAEPKSGRVLTVSTDEDWLQFYTGFHLSDAIVGKSGRPYRPFAGLCLECQGYANALGQDGLGDILVRPGRPQRHATHYAFSAD